MPRAPRSQTTKEIKTLEKFKTTLDNKKEIRRPVDRPPVSMVRKIEIFYAFKFDQFDDISDSEVKSLLQQYNKNNSEFKTHVDTCNFLHDALFDEVAHLFKRD